MLGLVYGRVTAAHCTRLCGTAAHSMGAMQHSALGQATGAARRLSCAWAAFPSRQQPRPQLPLRKRVVPPVAPKQTTPPVAPVGPKPRGGPVTWKSLLVVLAVGAGLTYYFREEKRKVKEHTIRPTQSMGRPHIGGPFTLTSHTGATVSDTDYRGKWMYVYFGFTHCPDVCPDELEKIGEVLDMLEKAQLEDAVVPLFISIDPKRDSVEVVKEYIKDFHPRMVGLTGTKEEVMAVAKAYRVHVTEGPSTTDDPLDYLVDHSIIVYLMDPEGNFCAFYGQNSSAADVFKDIQRHMKSWRPSATAAA